jgi:3-methyladenine DNA glycosylase/8-oxoguanine DNA glycosylase
MPSHHQAGEEQRDLRDEDQRHQRDDIHGQEWQDAREHLLRFGGIGEAFRTT